ncbi:hypothetical protein GLOTRDRAFT_78355 [Gloeophyllum trabeum ATCC 11539]|uniref:Xylanolytic transcriptional activator regulatory domain-containing protein n=1 Tax=Gloeophyllum trabeum (strain ATCC 11539 / FP-39264 / Madison 617) TaxID=670483 RepID=S7RNK5_GLOTA|nr:uncharacterized protein GLOTRDRAFT_78355 [Gloeophyllum trabeum ATCC 11539]EPQ54349.1 hypothetical protein GLOTRDRAFT_78355 [Gloeophyllum trabeum ATCC 11539]
MQPWELGVEKRPDYQFPEPDLMAALLKLHYDKVHSLSPVLHWPTFERGVREGLHLRDYRFGAVLMMVCATAARYSDDPRVMLEGHDSPASAGWKWFHQVQDARKSMLAPTTLYDLQLYSLLGTFLIGSSAPHAAWIAIGHGIRMAQDVGAHRRKFYGDRYTVKSELWKRAFWALILHDRGLSAALGRPYTLSPKEIDVELPVECDDEYWITSNPDDAFKQPAGKPTRMTFFIHMIKMNDVLGDTLRVFVSKYLPTAKPSTPEQDQQMIAELDSALNNWFDGIPPHCKSLDMLWLVGD